MALDPEFIALLRCPESRQPVSLASTELLANVNEKIRAGALLDKSGLALKRELDGGLLREDGTLLYPIWDDLPDMLVQDAIPLPEQPAASA